MRPTWLTGEVSYLTNKSVIALIVMLKYKDNALEVTFSLTDEICVTHYLSEAFLWISPANAHATIA